MLQAMRSTVHTLLIRDSEVFLMRRVNAVSFDGLWTPPAGRVEVGEHVLTAAVRETYEESNARISEDSLALIGLQHRQNDAPPYIDLFFECRKWVGEPVINEPENFDRCGWFHFDGIPENCIPGVHRIIKAKGDWPIAL